MTAAIALQEASVAQQCKLLHLPAVGGQFVALAEQAVRERQTHVGYLEALFATVLEERERDAIARRLKEAHLPRVKTLDEFDFSHASHISASQIRELADGGYIARAEPVVLIGDCGTGKTHLLTGLCVAACRQKTPRPLHHRGRVGQRARGSQARDASRSCAGPVGPLRRHRD